MKSNAKYFGYLSNYDMSDGYLFLLGYCIEKIWVKIHKGFCEFS